MVTQKEQSQVVRLCGKPLTATLERTLWKTMLKHIKTEAALSQWKT